MDYQEYLEATKAGPIPSEMPFPREEYDARLARIRKAMAAQDLDALVLCDAGNMFYVSGYYTFETSVHGAVVIPAKGEPFIQVLALEASNPLLKGWIENIVAYTRKDPKQMPAQLAQGLSGVGAAKGRIGIEAAQTGLRIAILEDVKKALPDATFVDATGIVLACRRVKSERELACHRQAGRITMAGMRAARTEMRAGVTENDVAAAAYNAMVRAGSEFMCVQPIVASGHRHAYNHTHFFRRRLEPGDSVMLEFGAVFNRHTSPVIRTGHVGKPSDEFLRISDAARECADAVIAAAKPGRTGHDVAMAGLAVYAKVAKESFHYGTFGYCVGCQFPPSWVEPSAFFVEGNETVLEPGMVFHLPICFRVPRRFGAGYSETIAIGPDGAEVLTDNDRRLYVA